ncbi:MAG: tetratricopeptide repeat protein [Butyrivibrio sp.]|nr:tetratricopeptide repeat protein [Butyrivibrio sp.]
MKKSKKPHMIICTIILALVVGILVYFNLPQVRVKRALDLGNKYLEESDYYRAVAEFDKALKIDPDNAEIRNVLKITYCEWADTSLKAGDYEKALAVLSEGAEKIGDQELLERQTQVYLAWADDCASGDDYENAVGVLSEILNISEGGKIDDACNGMFENWIEHLVDKGDYEKAREITSFAQEVFHVSGEYEKKQKDIPIKKHRTVYSIVDGNINKTEECSFDVSGRLISIDIGMSHSDYFYNLLGDPFLEVLVSEKGAEKYRIAGCMDRLFPDYEVAFRMDRLYQGYSVEYDKDERGNIKSVIVFNDKNIKESESFYNDSQQLISRHTIKQNADGESWSRDENKFDDRGRLVEHISSGSSEQTTIRTYEYDDNDWLHKEYLCIKDGITKIVNGEHVPVGDSYSYFEYENNAYGDVINRKYYYIGTDRDTLEWESNIEWEYWE